MFKNVSFQSLKFIEIKHSKLNLGVLNLVMQRWGGVTGNL